jgi:hypothetical protein
MDDLARGAGARRMLGAGAVIALIALAFWIGRATSPDPKIASPEEAETANEGPGPTGDLRGVPVGYARTEEGAIAAASNFARLMSTTTADPQAFVNAFEVIAAPDWRKEARTLAEEGLDFVRERYGSNGILTFTPVRYRLSDFDPSEATVEVWGVTLATGEESSEIDESWVTGRIELRWSAGDWRVAGGTSSAGPTPLLLQAQDDNSIDVFEQFQDFDRAPAP